MTRPGSDPTRPPGDGWVECTCSRKHWGRFGAAGLLLARLDPVGRVSHVVLQHRALWSDQGGTWGIPGGAVGPDETPEQGALREANEEAGIDPDAVRVVGEHLLDHGAWRYTTILAVATDPRTEVRATDPESLEVAWVAVDDVADRPLLPAFGTVWRDLVATIDGAR